MKLGRCAGCGLRTVVWGEPGSCVGCRARTPSDRDYPLAVRSRVVADHAAGVGGYGRLARMHRVNPRTVARWVRLAAHAN